MSNSVAWFPFVLSALAVWRLTHLLSSEDGPWDVIARARSRLGSSVWGKLMDCFYCLSIYVSVPFAFLVAQSWPDRGCVWLALSGSACLLNRLGTDPIVFHALESTETKGEPQWHVVDNVEQK